MGSEYKQWVTKLLGYDFEISYRTGAFNRLADALSKEFLIQWACKKLLQHAPSTRICYLN